MEKYTLLVCDDDKDILSALRVYLAGAGYDTITAENGADAVRLARDNTVHLVLLDVMMPIMDGIAAAVHIREFSNVPIIFLSAKAEDADRILGLDMGGDDYITKPFVPAELFARVKSAIRRYALLGGAGGANNAGNAGGSGSAAGVGDASGLAEARKNVYRTGGLVLDDDKKLVTVDGDAVSLTALEYNILKLLISRLDMVFSSAQIYEAVWDEPAFDVSKTVSVHIRHIREKIELSPKEPRYLKVVYGMGYKVVKV